MNQRVPIWELEDPPNSSHGLPINPSPTGTTTVDAAAAFIGSRLDYEVTELTWVNGHPSMHGLRHFRMGKLVPKCPSPASWDKVIAGGGTLESVVDQATGAILLPSTHESPTTDSHDLAPWVRPNERPGCSSPATGAVMEALEPCSKQPPMLVDDHSTRVPEPPAGATVVSGVGRKRGREWNRSHSGSAASMRVPSDACDNNGGSDDVAFTTSTYTLDRSPGTEHASCGKALTVVDEDDSASPSRRSSKDEGCCVGGEKKRTGEAARSSVSTKRSRAAAVHNQSERKRRERINQRIKTLQKLVPNSIKTDKASILDEAIEYLKHLQAQVQMMGRSSAVFHMAMPMPVRQQLQMAMMAKMAQTGMDLNTLKRPPPSQSTVLPPSAAFFPFVSADRVQPPVESTTSMPTDPFSVFMAGQPQKPLMSIDAFSRMASVYQQAFQQPPAPPNPNPK